jgi:hypothetical protein
MKCPESFIEVESLRNLHSDALRQDACGKELNSMSLKLEPQFFFQFLCVIPCPFSPMINLFSWNKHVKAFEVMCTVPMLS